MEKEKQMSIAEMFLECLMTINVIANEDTRNALLGIARSLIEENAVSITKDLFNSKRRHLTFIDGSTLTKHKDNYSLPRKNGD